MIQTMEELELANIQSAYNFGFINEFEAIILKGDVYKKYEAK